MQLTVNRSALAAALATVSPAIPSRGIRPILQNVRLSADGKLLRADATDLDLSISAALSADIGEPGSTLVPGAHLTTLIRRMRAESVTLTLGTTLRVESTDGRFELPVVAGDEAGAFPALPEMPDGGEAIASAELSAALRAVRHATATNEAMYSLAGVLFDADEGAIVATDTHRVAVARVTIGGTGRSIIPAKSCDVMAGLCAQGDTARIVQTERLLHVACGDTRMATHLIEGNFPRWNEVIPATTGWPCAMRVDCAELLRAVELARMSAADMTRAVRITIGPHCEASSESPEHGKGAAAIEAVDVKGSGIVTVNGDYLAQAAISARGDTIEMFV